MAKYKWDLNYLNDRYKQLLSMYDNTKDKVEKETIQKSIIIYYALFNYLNKKKDIKVFDDNLNKESFDYLIADLLYNYNTEGYFDIIKALACSYDDISDYLKYYDTQNPNIREDNDKLVDVACDFFEKKTPNYLAKQFYEMIDNNKINISFSKDSSDYGGATIYEPQLNDRYIAVSRSNRLKDFAILPHEAFHYIFTPENISVDACLSDLLMEVEGSLCDILFADYFEENSSQTKDFFHLYFNNVFASGIEDLAVRHMLIDSLRDNKMIRFNKLNKYLATYTPATLNNEDELRDFLVTPQDINMRYTLSTLVAMDLYYIYKEDPDKCFYLLKNIRYNVHEKNIMQLLRNNEITFMDDGSKNFIKYLKRIS